jgi:lactoylglutathione lyase
VRSEAIILAILSTCSFKAKSASFELKDFLLYDSGRHIKMKTKYRRNSEMISKIATAAVYVEDQQKAKNFWVEKVGFELIRETPMGPAGSWLEVAPKGAQSALVLYPRSMMEGWETMRPSIVFECEDIDATYERMTANGVKFEGAPNKMQWGTFAQFKDEDGNTYVLKG